MPSREIIDRFLAQRHIAVVGVSRDPKQFANAVYRQLRTDGRSVYPVNATAGGAPLEGDPSFERLAEVPHPLDGVVVMVAADRAADVVREAIDAGVPRVWLHKGVGRGSVSDEAVALCREHGIEVVDGACPMMFDEPVAAVHRVHRFFAKRHIAA